MPSSSSSTPESHEYLYQLTENTEDLEEYSQGGYHPIHINDEIHNGRFIIIHKLGYGGNSTVWLARDRQDNRFVALKFVVADISENLNETRIFDHLAVTVDQDLEHPGREYVSTLLEEFEVHGPNGTHRCLVTDVVGPSVSDVLSELKGSRLPFDIARKVAWQCASGLAFLHSRGVVHGGTKALALSNFFPFGFSQLRELLDLHTGNILFEIPDFQSWSVEQVYENLGEPRKEQVTRLDGGPLTPCVPTYVVHPLNPTKFAHLFLNAGCRVRITDFGESFLYKAEGAQKPTVLGTPVSYAAPEVLFDESTTFGPGADVWSLACTTYEILGNQKLFESFLGDRIDVIVDMVKAFGKFPERWWKAWATRGTYFEEDGTPKVIPGSNRSRIIDLNERLGDLLGAGKADVEKGELDMLEGVLAKMMRYEPQDRIGSGRLLEDGWFKMVEMSTASLVVA